MGNTREGASLLHHCCIFDTDWCILFVCRGRDMRNTRVGQFALPLLYL